MLHFTRKGVARWFGTLIAITIFFRCAGTYNSRDGFRGWDRDQPAYTQDEKKPPKKKTYGLPLPSIYKQPGVPINNKRVKKPGKTSPKPKQRKTKGKTVHKQYHGKASYYGGKFHGRRTASGEVYNQYQMTAAHRTLPFGSVCRVTNLYNDKTVHVRINDRGPFIKGRIIDLSYAAAKSLDAVQAGVIKVKLEVLTYGKK